jgi:hypothetical protein
MALPTSLPTSRYCRDWTIDGVRSESRSVVLDSSRQPTYLAAIMVLLRERTRPGLGLRLAFVPGPAIGRVHCG